MIQFKIHNVYDAPPSLKWAKAEGVAAQYGLMQFFDLAYNKQPSMADQKANRPAAGEPPVPILSRKPRHLPVIMKRYRSKYCGSVHHTAYYFTDGYWESQEKFHKNIKYSTISFGRMENDKFFDFI